MKSIWEVLVNTVIDNYILQFHLRMDKVIWWISTQHKQQTKKIINRDLKVLKQLNGSLLASPNASHLDFSCVEVQWGFTFWEKKQGQV